MAQRLDTPMPGACGGRGGRPVILSILFVSLFACSLAASSPQHQQQWRNSSPLQQQQQRQSIWKRAASEPGLLDRYFEPLFERPTVYAAPAAATAPPQQRIQQAQEIDSADDEQFLRQLKVAAEYLDEKLAARQREQQQRALLAKLGRFVGSSSEAAAEVGRGPAYLLGGGSVAGGGDFGYETGATSGHEPNVVVVAPSVDSAAPDFSESPQLDLPNYRLLDDAERQASEQQTYDHYKQLLQTLLAPDRAQPAQSEQAATPVKRESDSPAFSAESQIDERPQGKKLTTLVEEDENVVAGDAQTSETTTTTTTTTEATIRVNETNSAASQPPATAYGKVVYEQNNTSVAPASASSSGVFGRMYAQLSRYLPFMSQISILRNPQSSVKDETKILTGASTTDRPDVKSDDAHNHDERQHKDKQQLTVMPASGLAEKGGDQETQAERHPKPSVSVSLAHNKLSNEKGEDEDKNVEDQDNQNQKEQELNDKHLKVKVSIVKETQGQEDKLDEDKTSGEQQQQQQVATMGASKSENAKRLISVPGPDNTEISELDLGQMMPVIIKPHAQYNHLMRQSQNEQGEQGVGSLLGKYIYAPTQHYYLNSVLPTTSGSAIDHQHRHQHQLQAAGARHFQPGDQVYGSYGPVADTPMKAAYAYQKDPSMIGGGPDGPNSLANKTNDLYFLVMVGAFCVMAMAVVLAAGAFAYRVQQSRKCSQETDYPTYGVVGPNNMSANGKCGASPFTMGGYFMGPPGGAGGASKSGSAKHLADLYGGHATSNGGGGGGSVATSGRDANGGSDSGLNSLGRSSHSGNAAAKKAASSSASSLNNGADSHQPGGRGNAPGSFMSAASQDAARMYHYQHQKQQMIISDRNSTAGGRHTSASDLDSEEENDDGSYTVYECPGLASAHEMEIKNPLFNDDQTP